MEGSETQKWRSHGGLSAGKRRQVKWGEKVQRISSIKGRKKIDMGG